SRGRDGTRRDTTAISCAWIRGTTPITSAWYKLRKKKGVRMPPAVKNGKICYIEIPAIDIQRSSEFYARVFGWQLRTRGDGRVAFDDGVEVSGTWVTGRPPSPQPGLLLYIMVDDVNATIDAITANGGEIVQPV